MSTLTEQIDCVKREIALRVNTYPRFVRSGRMKQHIADREISVMRDVLRTLIEAEGSAPPAGAPQEDPRDREIKRLQGELRWAARVDPSGIGHEDDDGP